MTKTRLFPLSFFFIKPTVFLIFLCGWFWVVISVRGEIPQGKKLLEGIPPFSIFMKERKEIVPGARASEVQLNHPSFQTFASLILHPDGVQRQEWQPYIDYFQKATVAIPQMVNAYALLGYLYHQVGEDQKAIVAYQQALSLYPRYFWFHHNLGVLYFQKGLYQEAANSFNHAVFLQPKDSFDFFNASWFYQQIWGEMKAHQPYSVGESLKKGYYQAYLLLLESLYRLNNTAVLEETAQQAIRLWGYDAQLAGYLQKQVPGDEHDSKDHPLIFAIDIKIF